jgi:hypothetical protein
MDRLTGKHYGAEDYYMICSEKCAGDAELCVGCPEVDKIINRLGAYEDTGLTPEEVLAVKHALMGKEIARITEFDGVQISQLRELAEAEKDGRLVVLPAKTVFELGYFPGKKCDGNCPVLIDGRGCCDFCDNSELAICKVRCRQDHIPNIGKTVFLTCDDAEAASEAQKGCGER